MQACDLFRLVDEIPQWIAGLHFLECDDIPIADLGDDPGKIVPLILSDIVLDIIACKFYLHGTTLGYMWRNG